MDRSFQLWAQTRGVAGSQGESRSCKGCRAVLGAAASALQGPSWRPAVPGLCGLSWEEGGVLVGTGIRARLSSRGACGPSWCGCRTPTHVSLWPRRHFAHSTPAQPPRQCPPSMASLRLQRIGDSAKRASFPPWSPVGSSRLCGRQPAPGQLRGASAAPPSLWPPATSPALPGQEPLPGQILASCLAAMGPPPPRSVPEPHRVGSSHPALHTPFPAVSIDVHYWQCLVAVYIFCLLC